MDNNYTLSNLPPNNGSHPTNVCTQCGTVLGENQLFCPTCGTRKQEIPPNNTCKNCGAQIPQGVAFCTSCGQRVDNASGNVNSAIEQFNNNIAASKKKKSALKKGLIFGGIGLVVVIAIIVFIALNPFGALNANKESYEAACTALDNGNYKTAYEAFIALDGYEDSNDKIDDCIYEWVDYILDNGTTADAESFKNTVRLSNSHHSTIYTKITNEINAHNDFDYWDDYWYDTDKSTVIYNLLQSLPSSYQDNTNLSRLFKALSNGDVHPVADYIRNNKVFLESVWYLGLVQNFLTQDDMIYAFLEGYWETADGEYYLNFYQDDEGGTSSSHDLPWVEKPSGTMYYGIKSLIYSWEDGDGNSLAKVYRFTITDFNTMTVYCYKDNRTYKLYR